MIRIASVLICLSLLALGAFAQRRSPLDRMTHHERKKLEGFEDRQDPYRPPWLATTRFTAIESLRPSYPFDAELLEITNPDLEDFARRFAVVAASGKGTLFLYDRETKRLVALAEFQRRGKRTTLGKWVRYHPSFTEFSITDLKLGDNDEPQHGATRSYLRSLWHASSNGRITTGTGPFRTVVTNTEAVWLRDGVLAQVQKLLDIPLGPTHDDLDRVSAGAQPYTPAWAESVPFKKFRHLNARLPFKASRVDSTPIDSDFEIRAVRDKNTLLAYGKKTKLLAYLIETRPRPDGTRRSRLVAYHPSYSAYTTYDISLDALRRPVHRMTTRFERERWRVSAKNRRKVEGEGPFIRKWQFAAGTADFGDVLWNLLAVDLEGKGKDRRKRE